MQIFGMRPNLVELWTFSCLLAIVWGGQISQRCNGFSDVAHPFRQPARPERTPHPWKTRLQPAREEVSREFLKKFAQLSVEQIAELVKLMEAKAASYPKAGRWKETPGGTLLKLWWNPGGTLVEPSWSLTSGLARTTPEPIWAETPKLSAVGKKAQRNRVFAFGRSFFWGRDPLQRSNKTQKT